MFRSLAGQMHASNDAFLISYRYKVLQRGVWSRLNNDLKVSDDSDVPFLQVLERTNNLFVRFTSYLDLGSYASVEDSSVNDRRLTLANHSFACSQFHLPYQRGSVFWAPWWGRKCVDWLVLGRMKRLSDLLDMGGCW